MSRKTTAALVVAGVVAAAAATWITLTAVTRPALKAAATRPAGDTVDDLLMDLQVIPLDGEAPKPFALPSLAGRTVALADLAGRPALLYFWATW